MLKGTEHEHRVSYWTVTRKMSYFGIDSMSGTGS